MLQNLSEEIRECLRRAEECKQLSKSALTPSATKEYLEMEQRWLALARSYEFAERLSKDRPAPRAPVRFREGVLCLPPDSK
jgi:hypothetical protein